VIAVWEGERSAIALSPTNDTLAWAGQPPTFPSPIVRLWKVESDSTPTDAPQTNGRNDYEAIDLPDDRTTAHPEAFAQKTYGLQEQFGSTQETMTSEQPEPNFKIVTLTQTNLKDDSVGAMRYRLEFEQQNNNRWKLIWVGRQHQCQRGLTNRDEWTTELCL